MSSPYSESNPGLMSYLADLQKRCLPGIWSKGVALSREGAVQLDRSTPSEFALRVQLKDRPVSPKVTLWPEDEDAFCDCGDRNEICAHIAACAIALKAGTARSAEPSPGPEAASPGATRPSSAPRILYRFTREAGALVFERVIHYPAGAGGKSDGKGKPAEVPLTDTLVSTIGGISSGRIASPPIPATREDFAVDSALPAGRLGKRLDRGTMQALLKALARIGEVLLDGTSVAVSPQSTGMRARLSDAAGGGYRLQGVMDPAITEVFANGAALCGNTLRPLELPSLSPEESAALSREGKVYRGRGEIASLVTEVLPSIERKLALENAASRLPTVRVVSPRIRLALEPAGGNGGQGNGKEGAFRVVPSVEHGQSAGPDEILVPEPGAERMLARKLQTELHLSPGQAVELSGAAAIDFLLKVGARPADWGIADEGLRRFGLAPRLEPRFEISFEDSGREASRDAFEVSFETKGGGEPRRADAARVFEAWQRGEDYVPLLGGGFAPLPADWLARYGTRVSALLDARDRGEKATSALPAHQLPELAALGEELGVPLPPRLRAMRERLELHQGIPAASLPGDLRAELRHYQRQGVDWLCLLRDSGMGAMLADDMGLGKTLQALCAVRGRTLIVAPTSVLSGWAGQIAQFRPGLRSAMYYGPARALDPRADVTITSYSILRLDRELLAARNWDTVVLDEAQTIKNPESQVARAAHALSGDFKIALSGTPVENRLDDLWSQFQFLNPGLLGTRTGFVERYASPIARGDRGAAAALRARIRPFLLRRLKKDVAPELPPRTETVLHCELSAPEKELYDSILAASRREVLEKLESTSNVLAALEMLLRLRQACCHPALVPGGARNDGASPDPAARSSSKLDLLLETLEESIGLGHRALVFSQWTSLLDLVEARLGAEGYANVRLDGSTRDRQAVVDAFQKEDGPPVMLISLKAGGVGLTLTAADHIFILDPWWNPAAEDQAADRAHRIGQQNPVLIHRLVAKDTVEDKILALQKRKLALASAALEDSAGAVSLTREDLVELLG